VQNWTDEPDFPGGKSGPWTHSAVDVWVRRNGKLNGGGSASDDEDEATQKLLANADRVFKTARAQKIVAEAKLLELKYKERNKEVVARDEVTAELEDVFAFLRDGLRRLPDDAANEVPAEQKPAVIAMLRRKIDGLLTEFANKAGRIGG